MSLRVMTFNLRNGRAADGNNSWPLRKGATLAAIRSLAPDIIGIQEGFVDQVHFLEEGLPEYERWGQGRHGGDKDEHVAIFFRRERLKMVEGGDFWLSETPSIPASKSWGTSRVRMATWSVLALKDCQESLLFVNTHLDHESQLAREKGAALIKDFIQKKRGKLPAVLTGDFNAEPTNPAVRILVEPPAALVDSYVAARKFKDVSDLSAGTAGSRVRANGTLSNVEDDTRAGTFHGFTGQGHDHIDYIFVTPEIQVDGYGIITDQFLDRWPSDHFPVLVELSIS